MKQKIAFDFVLERLLDREPRVKAMFGAHGIYIGEKIVMITRNKTEHAEDNGVWLATAPEHHQSLRAELPSLRTIYLLNNGSRETNWQNIPYDSDTFETEVEKACALINRNDPRIGRIPKARKKKTKP